MIVFLFFTIVLLALRAETFIPFVVCFKFYIGVSFTLINFAWIFILSTQDILSPRLSIQQAFKIYFFAKTKKK